MNVQRLSIRILMLILLTVICSSCEGGEKKPHKPVFVIMEGARYTETLGGADNSTRISNIATRIVPAGCNATHIMNNGVTATVPGYIAVCTEFYEKTINDGSQIPSHPSFMHFYLERFYIPDNAWLITSKKKLKVLASDKYGTFGTPRFDCGAEETDRNDAITRTDALIGRLFDYINTDPDCKGKTNMIITNDHGRHSDEVDGGFRSHGCSCEGCRHIMLITYGPDFRKGFVMNDDYEQIDIAATAAGIPGFSLQGSEGRVIDEMLINQERRMTFTT